MVFRVGELILWDVETGQIVKRLHGHSDLITTVAWRPDGKYFATATGYRVKQPGEIIIWDASTGVQLLTLSGHTAGITDIDWNADGSKLASSSYDRTVRIWNLSSADPQ